jgi:pimeloyl-ACP methyl ester carboxylesterase
MANFVLVHGGGHGGWCWQPVARRLRNAGHEVHAPTLTGLGERRHLLTPETSLDTHIEDVTTLLFYEDLREVVLVGHSYGGMVITGVADRIPDRIACLAYLDAAIPLDGESLVDVSPGLQQYNDVQLLDGEELGLWPEAAAAAIYGITEEELARWGMPRLTPHPWRCFEQQLQLVDPRAVARLPRAVVNCVASLNLRPPHLRSRWLEGEFVRAIDAGHDLMLIEPDATAALLNEIAAFAAQSRHDR